MQAGAIVIVEAQYDELGCAVSRNPEKAGTKQLFGVERFVRGPIGFVELLGRSVLEHAVEQFAAANMQATLVIHRDVLGFTAQFRKVPQDIKVCAADDIWPAVSAVLGTYSNAGIDCVFLARPNAYTEADFRDLLSFHCGGKQIVTRAFDPEGPLDLWVVNSNVDRLQESAEWRKGLVTRDCVPQSYFIQGYVKRLLHAQDLRQLVVDSFLSRCSLNPVGSRVRPGVWADTGAQVARGARIVGPAYLGRNCIIGEGALVTRSCNIESGSHIDYGTAVEDTSVLADTYVGMWLDVRHSLVWANRLVNLERGVLLEISDPSLVRSNADGEKSAGSKPAMCTADAIPAKWTLADHNPLSRNMQAMKTTAEFEP